MGGSPGDSPQHSGAEVSAAERPTLLLLDGEARNNRLLTRLLGADGYSVEACWSGAAALARVARAPGPDVLVLDVGPADQEALATITELLRRDEAPAIFVITAHPRLVRAVAMDAAQQGAAGPGRLQLFVKPLDYPALLAALARRWGGAGRGPL